MKTAFLYGNLEETIYMEQLIDLELDDIYLFIKKVCIYLLRKSLWKRKINIKTMD